MWYRTELEIFRVVWKGNVSSPSEKNRNPQVKISVARSHQTCTATSSQNDGHFGTLHGH
jgi:hypothetical protein